MANRFKGRIKRLEALQDGAGLFDEFTYEQKEALLVCLSELDGDDAGGNLSRSGMSRAGYEAALASISPGVVERLVAWCEARSES